MPEDRIDVTVNAGNSFDVFERLGRSSDRLASGGDRIGQSFLRGDRAVRFATQNITQGLFSANNAADAVLVTMQSLERVFKIPIGATIAGAAAIAGVEALRREFEKTQIALDDLKKSAGHSLALSINLSPEDISARIDLISSKVEALKKRMSSPGEGIARFFASAASGGLSSAAGREKEQSEALKSAEQELVQLSHQRADNEVKIAQAKADESKHLGAQISYEQARARLFDGAFKSGLNMVDLMKRLIALQITLNSELAKENEIRHQSVLDAASKFRTQTGNFFHDIGSGQFLKDLNQRNIDNQITKSGQDIISNFSRFGPTFDENGNIIDVGQPDKLGLNAQAMLGAARGVSNKTGQGLDHLLELDFSNLDPLSKYDFSGLAPLANMSILIQ